ncbi:MAG: D-amino acid dehydrogenase [Alphaproteobacteria bacterium]
MKAIVMGAGVVGVTTAYFLAKDGHEVTLIERQPAAAQETSFQNMGLLAVAHANAWASPRAPMILLKSLWDKDAALILHLRPDPRLWLWGLKFLRECTAERFRVNTLRKLRICRYSHEVMNELKRETRIAFDDLQKGLLYAFRDRAHFEQAASASSFMRENGVRLEVKTPSEIAAIEPAFEQVKDKLVGALYCPTDGSGDARLFSEQLAKLCGRMGVQFRYGTTVTALRANSERIEAVVTDKGEFTADQYVLSLGAYSPFVSRTVGVRLPIYPIKGYTASFPIEGRNVTPVVGGVDEDLLVAWGKFGQTFRVGGKAEFSGYDTGFKPSDFTAILKTAKDLFPNACDWTKPKYWACLRPMTPDGPPILGAAKYKNFHLNTGHGHIGWTMGCGSARIAADLVEGKTPAIDMDGLLYEGRA